MPPIFDVSKLRLGAQLVNAAYYGSALLGGVASITNTVPPVISGMNDIGSVLTVTSTGTWSETPSSYAYQWYRDAVAISGSTTSSYTSQALDEGATLTCRVRASTVSANSAYVASNGIYAGVVVPSWVERKADNTPAYFVLDVANNRGWYDDTEYASEAALLAATTGVNTSGIREFGPVVTSETNVLPNGDFTSGITGWDPKGTATLSDAGGMLQAVCPAANDGALAGFPAELGKAYRLSGQARNTVGANSNITVSKAAFASPIYSTMVTGSTYVDRSIDFGATVTTMYGGVHVGVSGITAQVDNLSVKEIAPFPLHTTAGYSAVIKGTYPGTLPVSNQAAFVLEDASGKNWNQVKLIMFPAGNVELHVRFNSTVVATFAFGSPALGSTFEIRLSVETNNVRASHNRASYAVDTVAQSPGVAKLRLGAATLDANWAGTVTYAAMFAGKEDTQAWFESVDNSILFLGDSLGVTGASTTPTRFYSVVPMLFSPARASFSKLRGGQNMQMMLDDCIADTARRDWPVVIWDWASPGTNLATYVSQMRQVFDLYTNTRKVICACPYIAGPDPDPNAAMVAELNVLLAAEFPDNFLDFNAEISDPSGRVPGDGLHMNDLHHASAAAAVHGFFVGKGW